jgi:hypothetical protein
MSIFTLALLAVVYCVTAFGQSKTTSTVSTQTSVVQAQEKNQSTVQSMKSDDPKASTQSKVEATQGKSDNKMLAKADSKKMSKTQKAKSRKGSKAGMKHAHNKKNSKKSNKA